MRALGLIALLLGWGFVTPAWAQEPPARLALLISNESYPSEVGRLSRPHEDVAVLADALRFTGFEVTTERDLDRDGMYRAVEAFRERLAAAGDGVTGFFYYAGHGASVQGERDRANYLMPARASITNADDLRRDGVPLDFVLDQVREGLDAVRDGAAFIVSDACRNTLASAMGERGGDRGFTVVRPRSGMFLAYSTTDGATAPDDGLFAETLSQQIRVPGTLASLAFIRTARDIAQERGDENALPVIVPYLTRDFCFLGCADETATAQGFRPDDLLQIEDRFRTQFQHLFARRTAIGLTIAGALAVGVVLAGLRLRVNARQRRPGVHFPRPPVLLRLYGAALVLVIAAIAFSDTAQTAASQTVDHMAHGLIALGV